jgi:hypothetical protein
MDGIWNLWGCKNEWQSCSMLMATGLQTSQNPVKIQSKSSQNPVKIQPKFNHPAASTYR